MAPAGLPVLAHPRKFEDVLLVLSLPLGHGKCSAEEATGTDAEGLNAAVDSETGNLQFSDF